MYIEATKRLVSHGANVNTITAERLGELKARRDALNELIDLAEKEVGHFRVDWGHFGSYTLAVDRMGQVLSAMGADVEGE